MFNSADRVAISMLCAEYDIPLAWALGVAEVESAGRAFWTVDGERRPAINLEGHYFYRNLPESKRSRAVSLGLAHPKAGKTKVPSTYRGRYEMLYRWMDIDPGAALKSISMGVGQVMGEHYDFLGYASPQDMWVRANVSLAGQVELMLGFIEMSDGLMQAIEDRDWHKFARLYNGPAYRRNSYAAKIERAVKKYERDPRSRDEFDLREEVRSINKLGFETVQAFQSAHGLDPDGIIGPITREAIEKALEDNVKPKKAGAKAAAGTAAAGATTVAVVTEVSGAFDHMRVVLDYLQSLGEYGQAIALVGASSVILGVTTYVIYKRAQTA
ncbi:DUF3380 domain-containing protein [Kaustia mangrovi]|uniref:DUF3380 domain-containing protein n=1 Tax=Kaustia mangrovi TaxID=2593653 RepID=A0A7S8HDX8_9HYPH|nr:N-acetylmuramidase domain-containing protein [Kaustia mangrovi]QPC44954.1 DUF3380 domain-containing protein [Kaustia mangrovi]